MTAFAAIVDALFGDPNIGREAVYTSDGGAPALVRIAAPIFLLVPQVKLPKRLDLARDAARVHEVVPGLIVANWLETKI